MLKQNKVTWMYTYNSFVMILVNKYLLIKNIMNNSIRAVVLLCFLAFSTNSTASLEREWQFISSGKYHSLAIKSDGILWAGGDNWQV